MKKEKAFIHNFLPSIMIYYTQVVIFKVDPQSPLHSFPWHWTLRFIFHDAGGFPLMDVNHSS